MTKQSDTFFVDSLRWCVKKDDEFGTTLLNLLNEAIDKHSEAEHDTPEKIYWQGRKDGLRAAVACYLNKPEVADLNRTTVWAYQHPDEIL